jgi:hypothetical protein
MNAWRRVSARLAVAIPLAIASVGVGAGTTGTTAATAPATSAAISAALVQPEPCEYAWQRGLPVELDGPLYAAAVYDDGRGNGPELYLGGEFFFGSQEEQAIVRWNGANLQPASSRRAPASSRPTGDAGRAPAICRISRARVRAAQVARQN